MPAKTKKKEPTKTPKAPAPKTKKASPKSPPQKAAVKAKAKKPVPKPAAKKTAAEKKSKAWVVIVNPNSGAGKTKTNWPEIESHLKNNIPDFEVLFTEQKRHATQLTRQAIKAGAKYIIAVGGDGTISEVASGFFDEKCNPIQKPGSVSLGVIASGSGSDLIRTLGISRNPEEAAAIFQNPLTQTIDMGKITYKNFSGKTETRMFINIAEVGIGGEVIEILDNQGKAAGGWISYQLATLRALLKYKNKTMQLELNKKEKITGIYSGVVVANGKFYGSGMKVAPDAEYDDGLFDVVLIGNMSRTRMIMKAGSIRKGTHIHDEMVSVQRLKTVKVDSNDRALVELDGELSGTCPVEFTMVPGSISVIVPAI